MIQRILPAILIFAAIGMFALYIVPTYNGKILPLKQEIKTSDSALAAAKDFNEQEAQLATERASIPAEGTDKIKKFMPDGVDNVQLILDLNSLAGRSGVTLSNFSIKDNRTASAAGAPSLSQAGTHGVESLDLSVTATGTYSAFRTFLNGIEHSIRPLDVTQVIVTDSASGVYSYDMTFRIYWLH